MKRLTLAIPLCLAALGLAPVPAVADPVTLTSGNVFYHVNDPLFVTLPSINGSHRRRYRGFSQLGVLALHAWRHAQHVGV